MKDPHGRTIRCLRVSVTDRCDLRCRYCGTGGDIRWLPRESILSHEEVVEIVRVAIGMGIDAVRLTGGEPLLRRGIVDLVAMLGALPGLKDLSLTTNGLRLAERAAALARAGLRRVNVSLDATDPARYREITGGGDVAAVLAGIASARAAGLDPVKLNCVVEASPEEPDARAVAAFACEHGLPVRFIRRMDRRAGTFGVVEPGGGGDCPRCNRLRLTCDGRVRPCLFSDLAFDVRALGAAEALARAVAAKPPSGMPCRDHAFHYLGG